jgi:hypothetical protein
MNNGGKRRGLAGYSTVPGKAVAGSVDILRKFLAFFLADILRIGKVVASLCPQMRRRVLERIRKKFFERLERGEGVRSRRK